MAQTITDDYGNVYELINGQWVLTRGRAPMSAKSPSLVDIAADKLKNKAVDKGTDYLGNKISNFVTGGAAGAAGASLAAPATEAATSGIFTTAAQNAAMNASAGSAVLPEVGAAAAPGMFSLGGIGSAGNAILPAAGLYGLYDLSQNRERIGTGAGYLEGAASGAAIGSFFGPAGAGIGAGLGLLGNVFGIGHKSRTKGEEHLRDSLAEQGVNIPNQDIKEWENNQKFAQSRNEADLTGKDIIHAADFYANIPGYANLDPAKQEAIANEALKENLIQEKLGKINLTLSDAYKDFLDKQLAAPKQSVDNRRVIAENSRERKKAALSAIMPDITAQITKSPRYDINPGALINNPYL